MEEKFNNLKEVLADASPVKLENIIKLMNSCLDDALCDDFFGTEGQWDPRGDHRESINFYDEDEECCEGELCEDDFQIKSLDDAIIVIENILNKIDDYKGIEDYFEVIFDKYVIQ